MHAPQGSYCAGLRRECPGDNPLLVNSASRRSGKKNCDITTQECRN